MRFRPVIHQVRNPFLKGVLYGIGLSGGIVSMAVAGYNAKLQQNWKTTAAAVFAAILVVQIAFQIHRNAMRGRTKDPYDGDGRR